MKHNHHDDNFRDARKHVRPESSFSSIPNKGEETFDLSRSEAATPRATRNGGESGMPGNQPSPEIRPAAERNKHFLNPIESVWPTPRA